VSHNKDQIIAGLTEALAAALFYQGTGVHISEWAEDWPTAEPSYRAKWRAKAAALGEDFVPVAPVCR